MKGADDSAEMVEDETMEKVLQERPDEEPEEEGGEKRAHESIVLKAAIALRCPLFNV
jgi:hypothetical protein